MFPRRYFSRRYFGAWFSAGPGGGGGFTDRRFSTVSLIMSYRLPTFNLEVAIWRAGLPTSGSPSLLTVGALHVGRRAPVQYWNHGALGLAVFTPILLPALTDVRGILCPSGADTVELPLGSGRFYRVVQVEDVAKGWPNEYRVAWCAPIGPWPEPIP